MAWFLLLWLSPSWQLIPTEPFAHFYLRAGEENWKAKSEKTHRYRQFNRQSKSCTHKAKQNNSPLPMGREVGVLPSPRQLGSITGNSDLGRQMLLLQMPLSSFLFAQFHMQSTAPCGLEYLSGQFGPIVLAMSHPNFLCSPEQLAGEVG